MEHACTCHGTWARPARQQEIKEAAAWKSYKLLIKQSGPIKCWFWAADDRECQAWHGTAEGMREPQPPACPSKIKNGHMHHNFLVFCFHMITIKVKQIFTRRKPTFRVLLTSGGPYFAFLPPWHLGTKIAGHAHLSKMKQNGFAKSVHMDHNTYLANKM